MPELTLIPCSLEVAQGEFNAKKDYIVATFYKDKLVGMSMFTTIDPASFEEQEGVTRQFFLATTSGQCEHADCPYPADGGRCEFCDTRFCTDHGTSGETHKDQQGYSYYVPAQCWKCGGYNVDAQEVA